MDKVVKEIQTQLKNKGFDPGPIDGDLGPKTLGAMKSYLSSNVTPMKEAVVAKSIPIVEKAKDVAKVVIQTVAPAAPVPQIDANTLKGRDRPIFAKNLLTQLGWKEFQAASLVGQFMQESYADLRTNVWGDNRTAFGIGQWRDNYNKTTGEHSPGRLTDLLKFANDRKKPIDDLETQVRFVDWELKSGSEKGVGKRLAAAKNIDEALEAAIGYERPRGYSIQTPRAGHGWTNREAFAKSLL